jgi:hypothetical protein
MISDSLIAFGLQDYQLTAKQYREIDSNMRQMREYKRQQQILMLMDNTVKKDQRQKEKAKQYREIDSNRRQRRQYKRAESKLHVLITANKLRSNQCLLPSQLTEYEKRQLDQFIKRKIVFNKMRFHFFRTSSLQFHEKEVLFKTANEIDRSLRKHIQVLSKNDISLYKDTYMLKNKECPITLNDITDLFIECPTCKICYDYYGTRQYFQTKSSLCCYCRQLIDIQPYHMKNRDKLYVLLRSANAYKRFLS